MLVLRLKFEVKSVAVDLSFWVLLGCAKWPTCSERGLQGGANILRCWLNTTQEQCVLSANLTPEEDFEDSEKGGGNTAAGNDSCYTCTVPCLSTSTKLCAFL